MKAVPDKEISYEAAAGRLEAIVGEMEAGGLDLEKSLQLFEEAVRLTRICRSLLENARQKVDVLLLGETGDPAMQEMSCMAGGDIR